ncbi:hypothetical protein CC79DRAFT_200123 [Sarocladium strictum]
MNTTGSDFGASSPAPVATSRILMGLPAILVLVFMAIMVVCVVIWSVYPNPCFYLPILNYYRFLRGRRHSSRQEAEKQSKIDSAIDAVAPMSSYATLRRDKLLTERGAFQAGSRLICAICLDVMEDKDSVRRLSCGHIFHSEGIVKWIKGGHNCCPLCNSIIIIKCEDLPPV